MPDNMNDMLSHAAIGGMAGGGTVGAGILLALFKKLFSAASKDDVNALQIKVGALEAKMGQMEDLKQDIQYIRSRVDEISLKVK